MAPEAPRQAAAEALSQQEHNSDQCRVSSYGRKHRKRQEDRDRRDGTAKDQSAGKHGQAMTRPRTSLARRVLQDIVARVVAAARPQKIILFGSAARGSMGPNSDVDLLVV